MYYFYAVQEQYVSLFNNSDYSSNNFRNFVFVEYVSFVFHILFKTSKLKGR